MHLQFVVMLVLGKVRLVADTLRLGHRRDRPQVCLPQKADDPVHGETAFLYGSSLPESLVQDAAAAIDRGQTF